MKQKVMALFLTALMAASVLGVAYATWSDTLTVTGSIETGTLDLDFCVYWYGDYEYYHDVGFIYAHVSGDQKTLYLTASNVYPCYSFYVYFDIYNYDGTIPAVLTDFSVVGYLDGTQIYEVPPWLAMYWYAWWPNGYGHGGYDLCGLISCLSGTQLDQGQNIEIYLLFHIYEDLTVEPPQGATLSFTITFSAIQWNVP